MGTGTFGQSKPMPVAPGSVHYMTITVKAKEVHDRGDGRFDITVAGRDLTNEEMQMIEILFPTYEGKVLDLLAKEALIASMDK